MGKAPEGFRPSSRLSAADLEGGAWQVNLYKDKAMSRTFLTLGLIGSDALGIVTTSGHPAVP